MATEAERNSGLGAYSTPGVDVKQTSDYTYVPIGSAPSVAFKTTQIDPPAFVYIGREDRAVIQLWITQANQPVNVTFRILRPDGTVIVSSFTFNPPNARILSTFVRELTEGFLLSVGAVSPGGTVAWGTGYATISLQRGNIPALIVDTLLCKGFFTQNVPLSFPPNATHDTGDVRGAGTSILGAVPAAGADISETMPASCTRRLRTISATLVTAVAAANREAQLQITDGSLNVQCLSPSAFTQAASLTRRYTWAIGCTNVQGAQSTTTLAPIGDILLESFSSLPKIQTVTTNIQAADQWSAPAYEVEEWPNI